MNRRAFLKSSISAVVGTASVVARNTPFLTPPAINILTRLTEPRQEKDSPVYPEEISTRDADFVIWQSLHSKDGFRQHLMLPKEHHFSDGLFLEIGMNGYLGVSDKSSEEVEVTVRRDRLIEEVIPNGEFKRKLNEDNIPIILADIPVPASLILSRNIFKEAYWGLAVYGALIALDNPSNKIDRRESFGFAKRLFWGAVALWSLPAIIKDELYKWQELLREPWAEQARKMLFFVEIAHPEDLIMTHTNALVAYKALRYVEEERGSKMLGMEKPNFGFLYGRHMSISEWLRQGKNFCLDYLSNYPKEFLEMAFGKRYEMYYPRSVILEANGEQVREFSELKEKIKPNPENVSVSPEKRD
ncbi:hypothetical protein HYT18_01755 [Candidatus Microgenomates bacterium]|nr:hypothetical protein [Candidatus Microgenomates bacterium]